MNLDLINRRLIHCWGPAILLLPRGPTCRGRLGRVCFPWYLPASPEGVSRLPWQRERGTSSALWECGNRAFCDFQGRGATGGNSMSSLNSRKCETRVFHRRPPPGISTALSSLARQACLRTTAHLPTDSATEPFLSTPINRGLLGTDSAILTERRYTKSPSQQPLGFVIGAGRSIRGDCNLVVGLDPTRRTYHSVWQQDVEVDVAAR